MSRSSGTHKFSRNRSGVAAVEFAVSLPLFMSLVVGMVEVGRALTQAAAIEKGLRAGALKVARSDDPFGVDTTTAATNLVMRGIPDTSAPFLVPGWSDAGAGVSVTLAQDFVTNGVTVPVYQVTATVPFSPIFPIIPGFQFNLSHLQAHIGH